jgi:hypothetical protein
MLHLAIVDRDFLPVSGIESSSYSEVCLPGGGRTIHTMGTLWSSLWESSRVFRDDRRWYAYDVVEGASGNTVFGQVVSFGARLGRLREAVELTQEELAERAGLSRKTIS